MGIKQILNIVGIIAGGFVPFVPKLQWAQIGSELAGKVVDQVMADGTVVTDENGNPLSREELATRVQARFQQAIDTVTRISDRAQGELDRTDG